MKPITDFTGDGWEILERFTANCPEHGDFERVRTKHGERGRCPACEEVGRQRHEAELQERLRAQRIEGLLESSALPARFARKDFDNYNASTTGQKKALAECRKYVADLRPRVEAGACLVLIGPPGVGKTHLLAAIVRASIYCQCSSRYSTMTAFLAAVKGSWAWHGAELGGDFTKPTLLVLDELWIPQTGRDRETLLALLDARYLEGKPTLIGSNLTWPEMQKEVGMRFCDRLLEGGGQVLAIDGKSMRGAT